MNPKFRLVRRLWFPALLALIQSASAQSAFNLAVDFSAAQNPNGPWSFGWMPPSNSVFNLYSTHGPAYGLSLDEWHGPFQNDNGTSPPDVVSNPTDAPITISDTTWLPHQITFHPGAEGERSVIRWTSPLAGPVSVTAVFEGRSGFVTSGVEIYQNSTLLFSGEVLGTGVTSQLSFATNLLLQAGDTIDFRVHYGNGDWASDTTQIDAIITPVPQPSLTISSPTPDTMQIAWPTNALGYFLESATQIPALTWLPVTNVPLVLADRFTVIVGTTNQSQFFRLRKQ